MILDYDAQNLLTQLIEIINNETCGRDEEDDAEPTYEDIQAEIIKQFLMGGIGRPEKENMRLRMIKWIAYMWPEDTHDAVDEMMAKHKSEGN